MENKVKFGLKNVHIAVRSVEDGVATYDTPFALPGAVNLSMPPKGGKIEFYADDEEYFKAYNNQGYEGTLEIANVNDEFKEKILKEFKDKNGVFFESSETIFADFAMMFEFSGDKTKTRHILYNCSVERPNVESQTRADTVDVRTETLNITASRDENGYVKARCTAEDSAYNSWFTNVYKFENNIETASNFKNNKNTDETL